LLLLQRLQPQDWGHIAPAGRGFGEKPVWRFQVSEDHIRAAPTPSQQPVVESLPLSVGQRNQEQASGLSLVSTVIMGQLCPLRRTQTSWVPGGRTVGELVRVTEIQRDGQSLASAGPQQALSTVRASPEPGSLGSWGSVGGTGLSDPSPRLGAPLPLRTAACLQPPALRRVGHLQPRRVWK
jgi:hypothetical protein